MKKNESKTGKKSVFVMAMMIFASFAVKAADQSVSIDGLTKADAITSEVQAAIEATENSGTVTVSGTGTASILGTGGGNSIMLNIPAGVKVLWKANLVGSSFNALMNITGGTFEVATGGIVKSDNGKSALETNGDVIVSGGNVGKIIVSGESSTITVNDGTVSIIQATGENSTTIICGNGKVDPPSLTTAIHSEGNVEIKENAKVNRTGTYVGVAISATGANSTVTVSGGTVSAVDAQAISNANGTVIVSGGNVLALNHAISAKTIIISGNSKIQAGKAGGTNYTGAAISASDNVEIKDNAEIIAENVVAISGRIVTVSGGKITTAENSSTREAIIATGSNSKVTISGGTVSSRSTAISVSGTNSLVVVCGNGKVEGGLYGNYRAISTSGSIEIKDDAKVTAIYSTGPMITVSGGTVTGSSPISSHYSSDTNVFVSGGIVNTTSSNGYAIDVPGDVTVSGGVISATSGTAISGKDITVGGGKVSATSGRAIRGTNVTVSGGMVNATSGYAIDVKYSSDGKVIVNGGVVFAYEPVMLVNNENNFTGVSGTGVIIGWNQAAGNTSYVRGSSDNLSMLPAGCARWEKVSGDGGIAYENGTNKGFITLEDITITEGSGITAPQTELLQIYPNPVTTELHIKHAIQKTADYAVYNNTGQIVMKGKLQGGEAINVQSLSNGIYYLKIGDYRGKFIKK